MAFCKYSSSRETSDTVSIDSKFLRDYLGTAPENCLKVYLLGLLKCQNSAGADNTIEDFVATLGLEREDVINCFLYWQDQNLVQVLDLEQVEIRYLPTKDNIKNIKKIESKKYETFVHEVQEILSGRQIGPNEYYKYIDFIETNHLEPCDFNMIVKYCAQRKGNNINSNYILTVAKVWLDEGIRTADKIEEKIENLTIISSDANLVAKALKFRGGLAIEHQQMYEKWVKSYGFNQTTILQVAKKVSSKLKSNSFDTLDKVLTKYYEMKLLSFSEIEEYEANKHDLIALAKEINKSLGVYYESVDNEIDTYLLPWISRGFDRESLLLIANCCFKNSVRTLEGMDENVQKFYKQGLTSVNSINGYLSQVLSVDGCIKEILSILNIDRRVSSFDRSFYRTWTYVYGFSNEIIKYGASLSVGKLNAMQYLNALLTNWHDKKLTTLDEIKKQKDVVTPQKQNVLKGKSFGNVSIEEANALFDNLDEINL